MAKIQKMPLDQLESLIAENRRITAQLQQYANKLKHQCICGKSFGDLQLYNNHRVECQLLRVAIAGDIVRVARMLKRTPTADDYNRLRLDVLPCVSTFTSQLGIFRRWNDAIEEAGLTPNSRRA